ncbi:hypothetical protein PC119_g17736 [Phytophthora cactorum]|uniref:Uncharacterized protein n=1 Tax=Phytophthora cactorum TaxID=29920 RepID=A0A8T1C9H5_9STRA|nr:hypothetical protein PC117_g18051 [Phytophthora cactorum]KAG2997169.1 hypothetical protein PC119_g17736 [Phytophthora cactorum]
MTFLQRAMVEQFHESHVEVTLMTDIPLRYLSVVIDLEDAGDLRDGVYNVAQLCRLYSVCVLGAANLSIAALVNAFSQLSGVQVLDAERPRTDQQLIVDHRHYILPFNQEACPTELHGVTQVAIGSSQMALYHHRLPCSRCYSSKYTTGFCKVKQDHLTDARARGCRTFAGNARLFG